MRTSLRVVDGVPWFAVHDLEERYHDAARKLGYQDLDDGFGSVAPRDNPHLQRAYQNFERFAEPMIHQAASVAEVPWDRALLQLLSTLDGQEVDWWLLGSAALAVRGISVTPGDLDLVVADADVHRVEELLVDYLVQPVIATPGWVHNSFARAFDGCRIEWVGGVCPSADAAYPSDQGPIAASRLETVTWRGCDIRVPPLDLQLGVSRRRGLVERAAVIERALA